jgi:hypothetical protein
MKTRSKVLLIALAGSVLGAGCGPNYNGTYMGTVSMVAPGISVPPTGAQTSLTINHSTNADMATLSMNGGSFTARVVDGTTLTINPGGTIPVNLSTAGYGATGYPGTTYPGQMPFPQTGMGMSGTCTVASGSGSRNGTAFQLMLNFTPTAGAIPGQVAPIPGQVGIGVCPVTSQTFTGTKTQ